MCNLQSCPPRPFRSLSEQWQKNIRRRWGSQVEIDRLTADLQRLGSSQLSVRYSTARLLVRRLRNFLSSCLESGAKEPGNWAPGIVTNSWVCTVSIGWELSTFSSLASISSPCAWLLYLFDLSQHMYPAAFLGRTPCKIWGWNLVDLQSGLIFVVRWLEKLLVQWFTMHLIFLSLGRLWRLWEASAGLPCLW